MHKQSSFQATLNHGSGGLVAQTGTNLIKPLNKITWDSFSQIAKLSGDVDHEPSTPKSGQVNFDGGSSGDEGYDIE